MPRRIHILPDHLANQIAAGEVVERPASVVKELVENSIDAGAKRITVSVRNGGKTEIRVADDGCGMGREDAILSLDRHATSKIRSEDDLAGVRTLGFRGEALPSIASVSRLVLETAERDGDGSRLLAKAGMLTGVESCSRRVGTTIIVKSLFFNTPARAKFLRSTAAETRAISEVVTILALGHPEVAFSLQSNDQPLLDLPEAANVHARIADIWGGEEAAELIPVAFRGQHASVSGLVQRPHSATRSGRRGYFFVNGRSFADRFLGRAVDRGYQTTVAPGTRPSFFLFLEVEAGEVDVNVHPAKAEVRFLHGFGVEEAIEGAVQSALQPLVSAPSLGRDGDPSSIVANSQVQPGAPRFGPFGTGRAVADRPGSGPLDQMSLFVAGRSPVDPATRDGEGTEDGTSRTIPVMWQVHNTYIFAETRDGLIIVDQHSAHERVLYEQLMAGWEEADGRVAQRLLFPLTMRLNAAEMELVEQLGGLFTRIGFEIEEFGGRSIIVHGVPNPHPYFDAERCLREMLRELAEGSDLIDSVHNQHQRLALSYSCKAAIKAGQPLSPIEIAELFDRLFDTKLPFHDIHGRPTVVTLSLNELHGRFRRGG